ncbi:MAG: aminotransferase class I/II-fold pyridoxal phosphate-dependent enzyme, partial [Oceanospirillum sp.]|nr:aminotransferase class I/II-fold pyridoxal phosphate-dependent enzyme [Oceanospirillum sp.]
GIELLPGLYGGTGVNRAEKRMAVPDEGYQEHAWCWQKNGFSVYRYRADSPEALIGIADQCDVLVVINPNNPTGQLFDRNTLLVCHHALQAKSGWLVVDEAFIDAFTTDEQQELSVSDAACDSLIVLRSVGKFFGLAGIRSGFVLAGSGVIDQIKVATGPWPISGVTAWITEKMLVDQGWQQATRNQLTYQQQRLSALMRQALPDYKDWGQTPLFISAVVPEAGDDRVRQLQEALAAEGIWIRIFPETGRIRLGLVAGDGELKQLQTALMKL